MQFEKDTVQITPETGAVVLDGRYQVLSEIGKGGMGAVFLAKQLSTGKRVAVKFIHAHNLSEKLLERFKKEAGFMSSLTHPNLVTLLDYGVDENASPFLVMDYIEGESFCARLKREPKLTERELSAIFMQIAKAVAYLHSKKIIHRDLKPSNIVVLQDIDGEPLVKLLDLGIAKSAHEAPDASEVGQITETGDVIGSPAYMSPEQAMGQALDARSDIYSLGCMLYECLTGRLPFTGETPVQLISQRLVNEAPPITDATLAPHLVPVAMKCLARDPQARYADCNELLEGLRGATTSNAVGKPKPRWPVRKIGLAVAAVALVAGASGYFLSHRTPPAPPPMDSQTRGALIQKQIDQQNFAEAARYVREELKYQQSLPDPNETKIFAETLMLGDMERAAGHFPEAKQAFVDAEKLSVDSGNPEDGTAVLVKLGEIEIAANNPKVGLPKLDEAYARLKRDGLADSALAGEIWLWRGNGYWSCKNNAAMEPTIADQYERKARTALLTAKQILERHSSYNNVAEGNLKDTLDLLHEFRLSDEDRQAMTKQDIKEQNFADAARICASRIEELKRQPASESNNSLVFSEYLTLGHIQIVDHQFDAALATFDEAEKWRGADIRPPEKAYLTVLRGKCLAWAHRKSEALAMLDDAYSQLQRWKQTNTIMAATVWSARGDAYSQTDRERSKANYLTARKILLHFPNDADAKTSLNAVNTNLARLDSEH